MQNKINMDTKVYFIKLGEAGCREKECIEDNNNIYFGFDDKIHQACLEGRWNDVYNHYAQIKGNKSRATNITNVSRIFYESDESVIFITFFHGCLWWCHPSGHPTLRNGNGKIRNTLNGWHNKSLGGQSLYTSTLSGNLSKVQMYRGTICEVKASNYLIHRLNDEKIPEVLKAEKAEKELLNAILGMVQLLNPQDFELLVDLIFTTSGWRRQTVSGKTQETIDMDLLLPSTKERAFVQVKSKTNPHEYQLYEEELKQRTNYHRMFYVWHSGDIGSITKKEVTLWNPQEVAEQTLNAGLLYWLKDKVS